MAEVSIFVGSSGEAKAYAQDICALFREEAQGEEVEVVGWWEPSVFASGETTLESLVRAIGRTNAALLLATPDDVVERRGVREIQPRNNVLLEYGMFASAHGRARVALGVLSSARNEKPVLPSDLSGLNYVTFEYVAEHSDFRERNRMAVRDWLEQLRRAPRDAGGLSGVLPRLYQTISAVGRRMRARHADAAPAIDDLMAEMFQQVGDVLQPHGYDVLDANLVKLMQQHLKECRSISAVDVLGPTAWLSPSAYRYLSVQIRRYLSGNTSRGRFNLVVSPGLGDAIDRACAAAVQQGLPQSLTDFDVQEELRWGRGVPRIEFSRILIWTREELLSPISESLIAIHEAFRVPLFYKEVRRDDPLRRLDLLVFGKARGQIEGFYGHGAGPSHPIERRHVPSLGDPSRFYANLLADSGLMFAIDKRALMLDPPRPTHR